MPDGLDEVTQHQVIQFPDGSGSEIELVLIDGEHVRALGNAVDSETKLPCTKRHVMGQPLADRKPRGGAHDDQSIVAAVEVFA